MVLGRDLTDVEATEKEGDNDGILDISRIQSIERHQMNPTIG